MFILSLLVLVTVLGIGSIFGYTILEPVANAERGTRFQTRFFVCDFFTLTFLIAIPILFVTTVRRWHGEESIAVNIPGFILIGVFVYSWGRGATALSAVGVVDSRKRCCFLGALLPIAILGSAVAVPMLIMLAFSLSQMPEWGVMIWLAAILAAPVIARLCRRCTLWIVSSPEHKPTR